MEYEDRIIRYRRGYARLIRLHSKSYHERFGEGMEQTFADCLREQAEDGGGKMLRNVFWMFTETFTGIVKENLNYTLMHYKNVFRLLFIVILLLMIPFTAMHFTDEVNWTLGDFIVAGVLLFGTGFGYLFVRTRGEGFMYRAATFICVMTALLLTWVNLAVGIIGNENNPANLMYFAVPLVAIIGAFIAGFKPKGMSYALSVTAISQMLVPTIAIIIWRPEFSLGVVMVFGLNAFFAALWVTSAALFRRAAVC